MKDVEPKIEAIGESTVKKRDKIKELGETKSKMSDDFGYQDEQLKELRTEVEELKARTDSELNQLREDMQGVRKFISLILYFCSRFCGCLQVTSNLQNRS